MAPTRSEWFWMSADPFCSFMACGLSPHQCPSGRNSHQQWINLSKEYVQTMYSRNIFLCLTSIPQLIFKFNRARATKINIISSCFLHKNNHAVLMVPSEPHSTLPDIHCPCLRICLLSLMKLLSHTYSWSEVLKLPKAYPYFTNARSISIQKIVHVLSSTFLKKRLTFSGMFLWKICSRQKARWTLNPSTPTSYKACCKMKEWFSSPAKVHNSQPD